MSSGLYGRPLPDSEHTVVLSWEQDHAHLDRVEKTLRAKMLSQIRHWNYKMGEDKLREMFPDMADM